MANNYRTPLYYSLLVTGSHFKELPIRKKNYFINYYYQHTIQHFQANHLVQFYACYLHLKSLNGNMAAGHDFALMHAMFKSFCNQHWVFEKDEDTQGQIMGISRVLQWEQIVTLTPVGMTKENRVKQLFLLQGLWVKAELKVPTSSNIYFFAA